jgi:ubiquinone/menaquinone biosynthesis C-methylase UbiE
MMMPNPDKALAHLYRTTKPGGVCYISSWHRMGHLEIGMQVIKELRGEDGKWDFPPNLWKEEWNDPAYHKAKMEKAGFVDCGVKTILEHIIYPSIEYAVEVVPQFYLPWITFKEGEEASWNKIWAAEIRRYSTLTEDGVKIPMWANIAWGKK